MEAAMEVEPRIASAARIVVEAFQCRHKLLLCGNGGSAALCQHLAAEFVNKFRRDRRALPAIALTTDTSCLTAHSNDVDFSTVFVRQLDAFGQKGDVLLGISTSGQSSNVVKALRRARKRGLATILLTGQGGAWMAGRVDVLIDVSCSDTSHIQEAHLAVGHLLCLLVEGDI
jgi:D-sedoheptulose 7-phosphate isomerase